MNLLSLDTSTEVASVALAVGEAIQSLEQRHIRQHAQQLLPMIQSLMQRSGITWRDLDGIVFGSGPGSFTGLRITCAITKALAYAHDLPVFGVCSLDTIAYQARVSAQTRSEEIAILAMMDARMSEVYWAYYAPGEYTPSFPVQVMAPADLVLPNNKPVLLAGFGVETYQDQWPASLRAAIVSQYEVAPSAQAQIQLVQLGHSTAMTPADALPIYVRNHITQGGVKHG